MRDDTSAAFLGDHEAAKRLTDAGVLVPCPGCKGDNIVDWYRHNEVWYQCDACGRIFWTNYQGQSFPQHIKDAKENGWIHKKLGDRWKDFCPDCHEYELQKRRETYFKREAHQ